MRVCGEDGGVWVVVMGGGVEMEMEIERGVVVAV